MGESMSKVALGLFLAVLLLPIYFLFVGSFQNIQGVMAMPPRWIPLHPTLDNYRYMIDHAGGWGLNTLIVVAAGVAGSVAVSCTGGYAFAFFRFPAKRALWGVLLLGIMVPSISLIIPRYVVLARIGLSGRLAGVILPGLLAPAQLYLARVYFESIPASLLESARMDGASEAQVLWRVVAPVARPVVATLAVLAAVGYLSDFLWQMLVLQDEARQTLLVGLIRRAMRRAGAETGINPIGRALASGCVLLAPLLAVFAVGNRYMTEAVSGAVKE